MSDWTSCQTGYLFLLIGANPLPNYMAALLLAQDGGTVYLLHSGGARGTGSVARRLEQAIKNQRPKLTVILWEIDEADGGRIASEMKEVLDQVNPGVSVGLHYSGGTKAMAVHVYRAVEEKFPNGVFSYLDARTLSLIVDPRGANPTCSIHVGQACTVKLDELVTLHGYDKPAIRREPFQPSLCRDLVQIHSHSDSLGQWQKWLNQERLESLPDLSQYPLLQGAIAAFDQLCGGSATPGLVAQQLWHERLDSCKNWLRGPWLEEYVLWSVEQVAPDCDIGDNYGIDLKLKKRGMHEFQLDVAAIRGYQLFALSCMASDRKEKCKEHLLEAYVRARQMGGDEARVGLVCCYHDPAALQQEIEETWFTEGRVRVFGQEDLASLPACLQGWFETANDPLIVQGGGQQ
jgi:hypothetical protein